MRAALGLLSLMVVSAAALVGQAPAQGPRPLAFTHVTVVDATGAMAQPDMTVVVTGNRITALDKFGAVPISPASQVIDARGRFLIPGLQEMHTHVFIRANKSFPLYTLYLFLAHGITSLRDFGTTGVKDDFGDYPFRQDTEWRQAVSVGSVLGPRINMSLTVVNGPKAVGYPRTWLTVANAGEARQMVAFLKDQGADFIKEYDELSRDSYFALVDEARKQGIPVAGHVPTSVSVAEASDAGQRSLEHNYGVASGCSSKEAEFMRKETELWGPGQSPMRGILPVTDIKALIASYDEAKCKALFAKFVKNNTFVTPSMVRARGGAGPATDPRVVKWFSPALREYTYPASRQPGPPNPATAESRRLAYEHHSRLVKEMQRAGVKLLAGTDGSFFGTSFHEELGEFVKAGLTPMEALQIATRNAAEYYGTIRTSGTVEKDKIADLVLLDANPLESIENTKRIAAVVVNGRLLDRAELDRMLALVESPNHVAR